MPEPIRATDDVLRRVQGEFLEMPGLRLTEPQARRLWGLDAASCGRLARRPGRREVSVPDTRWRVHAGRARDASESDARVATRLAVPLEVTSFLIGGHARPPAGP